MTESTRTTITFGLAYLGYALLCVDVVRRAVGHRGRAWTFVLAAVVTAHVACVWLWRFEGSLQRALDKSIVGFVIFHTALLLILAGSVLRAPWSTRVLVAAFVVVSSGALPAPFRYDEIRILAIPMFALFVPTVVMLVWAWRRRSGAKPFNRR